MNFDLNFSPREDVGGEEEHVGEEEDQAMGEAVAEAGKLNIYS